MKTVVWRALNGLMAALFTVAIVVQYNDPDPAIWMILYAFPALLALSAVFGIKSKWAIAGATGYSLLALYLLPWGKLSEALFIQPTWHMISDDNEYAREAVGLLICAAWMAVIGVAWWQERQYYTRLVSKEEVEQLNRGAEQ